MDDELGRLDEDLSAGRLDAASYRRRRDVLLASRSLEPTPFRIPPSSSPESPAAGSPAVPSTSSPPPSAEVTPPEGIHETETETETQTETERELDLAAPVTNGATGPVTATGPLPASSGGSAATPVRDPFPPPFRWDDPSETHGSSPDATQVVADRAADRTQVVPAGAGEDSAAHAERTQVVPRAGFVPSGARRSAPPQRWPLLSPVAASDRTQFVPGSTLARFGSRRSVPAHETDPPWVLGRSTSPPADDRMSGLEVFSRGAGPGAATVASTVLVVLVVLAVLVLSFVLA